jgi:membrane protein
VPLAIVTLLVFTWINSISRIGFGLNDILYKQAFFNAVYKDPNTGAQVRLADKLNSIVINYFQSISAGSITIIGLVFVIWAAIVLIVTIEMAFNRVYNVPRGRSIYQKILTYWAMLTLGPLLIGALIFAHTFYGSRIGFDLMNYVAPIFPYLVTVAGLFALYFLIPNTWVTPAAALWGAMVASLIWNAAKWGFGIYVTRLIPYSTIYGILGLVPLAVLWIYVSWLIVLFGLELTYTTQNIKSIEDAEALAARRTENIFIANEMSFITLMQFIYNEFTARRAPVQFDVIHRRLGTSPEFTQKAIDLLVSQKLLVKTSEPRVGYVPAADAEHIRLEDISAVVAQVAILQASASESPRLDEIRKKQHKCLGGSTLREIIDGSVV